MGGDEQAIRAEAVRIRAEQRRQRMQQQRQRLQQLQSGEGEDQEQQQQQAPSAAAASESPADLTAAASTVLEAADILDEDSRLVEQDLEPGTPQFNAAQLVNPFRLPAERPN